MSKYQKIKNIKAFEESHKSFHFMNPEIMGCDLDYCYEKKGNVLILEGKQVYNGIFYLKFGQWHLLKSIYELNQSKVHVYYIIQEKERYWMIGILDDILKGSAKYISQGFFRRYNIGFSKKINLNQVKSYTKDEIKQKILNITNTFTKI